MTVLTECKRRKPDLDGAGESKESDLVRDGSVFCELLRKAGLSIRTSDIPNELGEQPQTFAIFVNRLY